MMFVCYKYKIDFVFIYYMRNLLIMMVLVPGISIIFAYTKANIWSFWLGFILCLLGQLSILLFYCFIKLQKAYRDSFTIKLSETSSLNPQKDYPFPSLLVANDFYFNRYTQETRLQTSKKMSLKSLEIQQQIEEIIISDTPYKQQILEYIKQIRDKYHFLNKFNQALIDFGTRVKTVADHSLLFRSPYSFALQQSYFKNDSFSQQFREEERRAFNELKIKLKSPKLKIEGSLQMGDAGTEQIVLPTWSSLLSALEGIGCQFQRIDEMRQSNSDILQMIHKKLIEDYQVLQKQIYNSVRSIEQIRQNLQNLKDEQQKLQKYQTNIRNQSNVDMIYWLKKQYFQFTNLSLRIKQNQKNYRIQVQRVRYYRSKLNGFYKQQKEKYDKVILTRYLSFLDSYSISIQDSLVRLGGIFQDEGYKYRQEGGPPKVREMVKSKNMNEMIAAELAYQEEYFERVEYYQQRLARILDHLQKIDSFLIKFKNIFGELVGNLRNEDHYSLKSDRDGRRQRKLDTKYFQPLFQQLQAQAMRIYDIIANLQRVNKQLLNQNIAQLVELRRRITIRCEKSRDLIRGLDLQAGPVRQRYKLMKGELVQGYKQIQEMLSEARFFQQAFQKHQNRIKKIVIVTCIQFLHYQRKMIKFDNDEKYFRQVADPCETNAEEMNLLETTNENKFDVTEDLGLEKFNHLETGYVLAREYLLLLNRFLFVAYSQWSKSQLFKQTISREIYVALNEEINESFAEILIEDFQLSGLPPEVLWAKELSAQQGQFLVDLNLSFRGKIWMKISTIYLTFISIPVELQISVQQFFCVMRLCFISNQLGCSWFSFVGEPLAKILIKPKIGPYQIDFDSIASMFQNIILKKLKETVYPIKKKITIPLYKKDEVYEFIQNRFKTMRLQV